MEIPTLRSNNIESDLVDRVVEKIEASLEGVMDRPSRMKWLIAGAAVGALAAIFLDPQHGEKRRAVVKEKWNSWGQTVQDFSSEHLKDLKSTATDVVNKMSDMTSTQHH